MGKAESEECNNVVPIRHGAVIKTAREESIEVGQPIPFFSDSTIENMSPKALRFADYDKGKRKPEVKTPG
jgi:hypothetical protein